jgi:hypothetical protein
MESLTRKLLFDTLEEVYSKAFISGATIVASLHLGFDVEGPLTTTQAKQFHKFVKPMLKNLYETVLKGDEIRLAEFESLYNNSMPNELLEYLLKQDLKFPS